MSSTTSDDSTVKPTKKPAAISTKKPADTNDTEPDSPLEDLADYWGINKDDPIIDNWESMNKCLIL